MIFIRKPFLALFAVVGAVGSWMALQPPSGAPSPISQAVAQPVAAQPSASSAAPVVRGLPDFADLAEKSGPAVVNIKVTAKARASGLGAIPFFGRPPGGGQEEPEGPTGSGSGFIIAADGYLLTNHHVVDGASEILVTLTDKREFKGKLIGSDERTDVALVKIEATGLPFLRAGDVAKLRVGEWVLAIGSPFGLDNTVTAGIVSAKNRDIGDYLPLIQTDAAVNPGNSGGPLLNMRGEVIGINSQILSRSGGFQGISLAIPIDEAILVSDSLRATGKVVRGRLGIGIAEVSRELAEALKLPRAAGAGVRSVEADSPAEKAGIRAGDIILKFEGKTIEKSSELPRLVGATKPGTKVTVQVWSQGKIRDVTATVLDLSVDRVAAAGKAAPGKSEKPVPSATLALSIFGVSVSDIPEERKQTLRLRGGVQIESVEAQGPAARIGLRPGDMILAVNETEITSVKQLNEALARIDRARPAAVFVRRGDVGQYLTIRPNQGKDGEKDSGKDGSKGANKEPAK